MRSTKVAPVAGIVALFFAVVLFAFSCSRSADPRAGADQPEAEREEAPLSGEVVDGVRVVEVKARQFAFEPSTIVVRRGERVRLDVTSEDVAHGIGIAAFDIDRTLPPNQTQAIEFTADQLGYHDFRCSVYCGAGHADMRGELRVVEGE